MTETTEAGTVDLLGLELAPDTVAAITNRIELLVHSLETRDESRSMDQLRADVLVDLLLGRIRPDVKTSDGVELRDDLTTLAEPTDHPGEVAGYGPIISDLARQPAPRQRNGEWRS